MKGLPARVPPNWWALQRVPPRNWLPDTYAAPRDPLSIGVAVLVNLGYTGTISGLLATVVGSAVLAGVAIGVSLLSSALTSGNKPPPPDPSDRQATIRQSVGARLRFYGRVKVGGSIWFFENKDGSLFTAITLNHGEIYQIVEIWLNDAQFSLDSESFVQQVPYVRDGGLRLVFIGYKMGDADQQVHGALDAAFDEVTVNHRLRGVANVLTIYAEVSAEDIGEVYPQGNPALRTVIDASLVTNVRTGDREWSDNPADIIYDYLTAVDGAGYPYGGGYETADVDIASFQLFADVCAELVPLKAGGTIPRYRFWGGFAGNEDQRTVLRRMLDTCDGELFINSAGKIAIRGGQWTAPVLTLDADLGHIISAEFRQGQSALAAFNETTITYTEPSIDYQEAEGQPWVDVANVALRGEVLSDQFDVLGAPHHGQARRLAKIRAAKLNPRWFGTIVTNFHGLNAIGETTANVRFPLLGIDEPFLIRGIKILDDLTGCQIAVSSLSASAYSWDPSLEEGSGPSEPPDTTQDVDLPPPTGLAVDALERVIEGTNVGVYLMATWDELDRPALLVEVQYQLNPAGSWLSMSADQLARTAESGLVSSGSTYNVRARVTTPGGVHGPWSDPPLSVVATP